MGRQAEETSPTSLSGNTGGSTRAEVGGGITGQVGTVGYNGLQEKELEWPHEFPGVRASQHLCFWSSWSWARWTESLGAGPGTA